MAPPAPTKFQPLGADPAQTEQAAGISYCLSRALDHDNEDGALAFLEYGADPNQRIPWHENRSHLHKAAMNGRSLATLQAMLTRDGDVNALDDAGFSPYRYALRFGHRHLVQLFEANGADLSSSTPEERLLFALHQGDEPGADVSSFNADDVLGRAASLNNVKVMARLLNAGAKVNPKTEMPPLHHAGWCGQLDAARLLLERGASLTENNGYGGDALGATLHGSESCHSPQGGIGMKLPEEITRGAYPELVELLINSGAPLPEQISSGSEATQEVLRRFGVPDEVE